MEAAQARADADGMSLSAFIRHRCCIDPVGSSRPRRRGSDSSTSIEAVRSEPGNLGPDAEIPREDGEYQELLAQFRRTMPLRNAESLAKAELRRRKERSS